jgi:hypothetical protein
MTIQTIGSRRQVWNGTAKRTSGGLTRSDLMMSHGRIVSKSKHFSAKKEMRLLKYGYGTKKGKFGYVKTKKSRKMRGGGELSPADASWERHGITGTGSNDVGNYGHAGGSGMKDLSSSGSASWNGDMKLGGKRRRRRHRR